MTFASDTTQLLYHQLPTARQVEFLALEQELARRQQHLRIEGVMTLDDTSEILVRITFKDE